MLGLSAVAREISIFFLRFRIVSDMVNISLADFGIQSRISLTSYVARLTNGWKLWAHIDRFAQFPKKRGQ